MVFNTGMEMFVRSRLMFIAVVPLMLVEIRSVDCRNRVIIEAE
jgi:hypothetical protein